MRMSKKGISCLAEWEGLRLQPYKDIAGNMTIGYGHMMTKEEIIGYANGITKEDALDILAADLDKAETCIIKHVTVPLQQHEFDALCSFVFNVGVNAFIGSTLLRRLNQREYDAVPDELRKWVRSGGKRSPGLARRRENEIGMWKGFGGAY